MIHDNQIELSIVEMFLETGILLKEGINLNQKINGKTLIEKCLYSYVDNRRYVNHIAFKIYKLLLKTYDIKQHNDDGQTLLMLIAKEGHYNFLIEILKYKPDINIRCKNNKTAFVYAIEKIIYDIYDLKRGSLYQKEILCEYDIRIINLLLDNCAQVIDDKFGNLLTYLEDEIFLMFSYENVKSSIPYSHNLSLIIKILSRQATLHKRITDVIKYNLPMPISEEIIPEIMTFIYDKIC
jgi:hypothetical protein